MTSLVPLLAVGFSILAAIFLDWHLGRQQKQLPRIILYLTFVLPFAAGGFHTYTAMITTVLLAGNLAFIAKNNRKFCFVWNMNTLAVFLVALGYCVTPLWAADRGMAAFGVVRYIPLVLYILTLMQYSNEEKARFLELIPLSGALMTLVSCLLLPLPGMDTYLTVNGRLSAFFQYPNTYAAFLLAGIILLNTKEHFNKLDLPINALLIVGVVLSGSRTGFLLLIPALIGIILIRRKWKLLISMGVTLGIGLILALIATNLNLLRNADRFASIGQNTGSFLVRLLYYKDALPVILRNPFGIGYLGYRATECTFQTGRYTVSFIHNGLLQMLLDIGWVPSLLMAAAFLKGMVSKETQPAKKLLLFIILAHCMLDFDLQFFVFWVILLSVLDFEAGNTYVFRKKNRPGVVIGAIIVALCVWLGMGDLMCSLGFTDLGLSLTPFHTDALSAKLRISDNPEELDILADRILGLCPTSSLAYSAKANAALARGQVLEMIENKEHAIQCARYSTEEYCDYFEKLYAVMSMYLQAGDSGSASYCANKLLEIPEKMTEVSSGTDPLAYLTGDDTELSLPEQYAAILDMLKQEVQQ